MQTSVKLVAHAASSAIISATYNGSPGAVKVSMAATTSGDSTRRVSAIIFSRIQDSFTTQADSRGSPVKIIQALYMAAVTLCLAGVALANDLQTVGDSDSLGFSARRLEHITGS